MTWAREPVESKNRSRDVALVAIRDYVDDHGVDLVVMGTHGRTGLDRFLLGSVTEKVVRTADVPVLTVRAPSADADAESEKGAAAEDAEKED